MRGWSEMESDDGEMSRRSGSSGGLRTETHLCLSHSALQSLSGPNPPGQPNVTAGQSSAVAHGHVRPVAPIPRQLTVHSRRIGS